MLPRSSGSKEDLKEGENTPLVAKNGFSGMGAQEKGSSSGLHALTTRLGVSQTLMAGACFCLASGSMVGPLDLILI